MNIVLVDIVLESLSYLISIIIRSLRAFLLEILKILLLNSSMFPSHFLIDHP